VDKKYFFSGYPSNFDRTCATLNFFGEINLDFRESQRRENERLLDESGNRVSQKKLQIIKIGNDFQ
jgi:hypothetical protein